MSHFGECNFSFLNLNSQVQIDSKLNEKNHMINNINMKNVCGGRAGWSFWRFFFPIWENFLYQIFVIILRDIIVLEKFILSFSQS